MFVVCPLCRVLVNAKAFLCQCIIAEWPANCGRTILIQFYTTILYLISHFIKVKSYSRLVINTRSF
jgi:hypothetical protein